MLIEVKNIRLKKAASCKISTKAKKKKKKTLTLSIKGTLP
jgi:hypothetical protein